MQQHSILIFKVFKQSDGPASMWGFGLCDGLKRPCMLAIVCAQHGHLGIEGTKLFQRVKVPYERVSEAR
jgi:hypothetical protein